MDHEILENIKNGDYNAFKFVYQKWKQKVYAYMFSKTADMETARNLTQNTFIKLWEYRSSVSSKYSAEQQIFQKARLIFIDYLRVEAKKREKFINENDFNYNLKHTPHDVYEEKQLINLAIESLPKGRKQIFEMKYIEGYSYKEIANMMSISIKTVDNQLVKAIKQLRKILQRNGYVFSLLAVLKNVV